MCSCRVGRCTNVDVPFLPPEVIALIASFLPRGLRLFYRCVNRTWAGVLTALPAEPTAPPAKPTAPPAVLSAAGAIRCACDALAGEGWLSCLRWACRRGWRRDEGTLESAASGGSVACLRFLLERDGCGSPGLSERLFECAAKGGDMACVRYLHAASCPWARSAALAAARHGHLAVLEYLVDAGCPFDARECHRVAEEHPSCRAYLLPLLPASRQRTFGGILTLLADCGPQDEFLTAAESSVTFWRLHYRRHSNFSIETPTPRRVDAVLCARSASPGRQPKRHPKRTANRVRTKRP